MPYDYRNIVISSGHGKYVRGASDLPEGLDEVDEVRKITERLATALRDRGCTVTTIHDDVSKDQSSNLNWLVSQHNKLTRQLDISNHLNAYQHTDTKPMGVEVLYYSDSKLAGDVSAAIAASVGLVNRGPKQRQDLAFLKNTDEKSILIEWLFCDSMPDCDLYRKPGNFDKLCESVAAVLAGDQDAIPTPPYSPGLFHAIGKCSEFGGPGDTGMTSTEGLAFLFKQSDKPAVFLPGKVLSSPALGRDLNTETHYIACRWDYDVTPKTMLAGDQVALVRNAETGLALTAMPADWGPHSDTDRIIDLSPSLMRDLQLTTDQDCEVIYPFDPKQGVV